MASLTREKLVQAQALVAEAGVDVWMTFVRETSAGSDPVLPLILEGGLTWESALIVGRDRRIAVVGNYDADPLLASGDWDEVIPYVQGIQVALLETLDRLCDGSPAIAVNYSSDDDKADGLTHGMFLTLERMLHGTRFEGCLVSAEKIVSRLRGLKTPSELQRLRRAIEVTDGLFAEIARFAGVGRTEREVYDFVQRSIDAAGYGYGWDRVGDPIVNSGPDSMIGHGVPSSTIAIEPGHVFHVDLGVIVDGYSSDIQRSWYVPGAGEADVPDDVRRACEAVNGAISAAAAALRPGVEGWTVDQAAREAIVAEGFPEYLHAVGHQVGRMAHDGGGILGPRWDRYGSSPFTPVEANQVYTLELGVTLPNRGYLGLEEMVVVTDSGCEFLSNRQTELPLL